MIAAGRAALVALCWLAAAATAQELPPAVAREFASLERFGSASLAKWGLDVYDATLWSPRGRWPPEGPFALELRYAMRFQGADIAERSVVEMRRAGLPDEALLARWSRDMARIFPDVRPGDRLVGVAIPGREARFYDGRRFLGAIADAAFVDAFFGIWLGERTSEPALRRKLLRLQAP